MDRLSLLGILLVLIAIFGGQMAEGGSVDTLINGAAAIIVFGGTLGAGMLQFSFPETRRALGMFSWVLSPPKLDFPQGVEKIVGWSMHARRFGLIGLEKQSDLEEDDFLRKGLQLIADGNEHESIRELMELELNVRELRDLQAAKVYESMGGYAPTIGIIGAVMGLIHVMTNLDSPETLGSGIATAFVATVYGVGIANLVLLPIAGKLKSLVQQRYQYHEMMLEGFLSIAQGHNPLAIRMRLESYLR
ncbi:flagellar motor protein [Motiliproteus sp.]|uniref:flagellar motor protein n=1 Tax=Motiliproteus sp. TaxID=1898955 RepID=UPI003BAAFE5D